MVYRIFMVASLFFSGSYLIAMQNELQFFFTGHAWDGVPAARPTFVEQERHQKHTFSPKIKNTVMQALEYGDVETAIELVKEGGFCSDERNIFKRNALMEVYEDIKFYRKWAYVRKNLGLDFAPQEKQREKYFELFTLLIKAGADPFEIIVDAQNYNSKSVSQVANEEQDQQILDVIKQ